MYTLLFIYLYLKYLKKNHYLNKYSEKLIFMNKW